MIILAEYDITIRRGNDYEELYEFQEDDGTAMDLTGYTIKSQLREGTDKESTLIADFTVVVPAPADGKVYLRLTDTQTDAITQSIGYYDILLTSPTDFDETYVTGTATIEPTITEKV